MEFRKLAQCGYQMNASVHIEQKANMAKVYTHVGFGSPGRNSWNTQSNHENSTPVTSWLNTAIVIHGLQVNFNQFHTAIYASEA